MRSVLLLFIYIGGHVITAAAQSTGSVSGNLQDSIGHQSLQGATIIVLNCMDSSRTRWAAAAGADEHFSITRVPPANYLLRICFVGYDTVYRAIRITSRAPEVDLGTIYLSPRSDDLDSIRVTAPLLVTMNNDTTEYNASRVKTRQYAVLADLLRKLPGIYIGSDGALMANGEPVDQLLVDGKPFFSGDPSVALENLPAEIIDKVKVYRGRSDQEVLTGFNHGTGTQTMNVTIKKNMARGQFGKAYAGAGTQNTYNAGASLNHFDGRRQVSLLGNDQNADNPDNTITSGQNQPNAAGITRILSAGVNYRDTWDKNADVSGSYVYNNRNMHDNEESATQALFPGDSSTTSYEHSASGNTGYVQNVNLNFTERIAPGNMLILRSGVNRQQSTALNVQSGFLTGIRPADTLYRSVFRSSSSGSDQGVSSDLSFSHQFHRPAEVLYIGLKISERNNTNNSSSNTTTDYLSPLRYTGGLDQWLTQSLKSSAIDPDISYTRPLDRHHAIQVDYSFAGSSNQTWNKTVSGKTDQLDTAGTNDFRYVTQTHHIITDYRVQFDKWQLTAGIGMRFDRLQEWNITTGETLTRKIPSLVTTTDWEYRFSSHRVLQLHYNGNIEDLTIQQLQPVTTTMDSLTIHKGNTSLKQPYLNTFSLSWRSQDPATMSVFSAGISGNFRANMIGNAVTQLSNGAQVYLPVNLDGGFNAGINSSYGLPVKKLRSMVTLTGKLTYDRQPGLLNNVRSDTRATSGSLNLSSTTTVGDKFDLNMNAGLVYSIFSYDFQSGGNRDFLTTRIAANISWHLGLWDVAASSFFSFNSNLPPGYSRNVLLISPSIARRIFRNKAGEIKFFLFDLLNRNSGITKLINANTIQYNQDQVRGRYEMLSFTYALRHFPRTR